MDESRAEADSMVTSELARLVAAYASGVGPSKSMLASAADVAVFHKAGLVVHPYTFRGPTTAVARRPLDEKQSNGSTARQAVIAEIQRFIAFGIDGGFTDYPALWKEAVAALNNQRR
jgi:glycerophosphoryl diester phosphodiesterase